MVEGVNCFGGNLSMYLELHIYISDEVTLNYLALHMFVRIICIYIYS